ncbi:hypothetical protein Tco_0070576, partial [Tanacetum coccineum]
MAPKRRTTRATPVTNTPTTTSVTNAQLQAMIDQGVTAALAAHDATRNGGALTRWNSHVMTVGHDVAYAMTWTDLKKKMTDKYCLRNEMKKLKDKLRTRGNLIATTKLNNNFPRGRMWLKLTPMGLVKGK